MPFPEVYTNVIFAAVVFFCFVTAIGSVPFYNTLYKKELLSDTHETRLATSPWIYTAAAFFGLAVGISFAFFDLTSADILLILMIPAAVTVCICDSINSFVPLIGLILTGTCVVIRMMALCLTEGALWPSLTFILGGIFGLAVMLLVNFIAKKIGVEASDKGHIALVTILWASAGIVPGAVILAAAEVCAIVFYIIPQYMIAKKKKSPIAFSRINYPIAPFLFVFYYAAASVGLI